MFVKNKIMETSCQSLRQNYWFKAISSIVLGLCLLFWPDFALAIIVKIIAAFLVLVGIITFVIAVNARSKTGGISVWSAINTCASIILGLFIFLFPTFFIEFLTFLFGAILIFAGIVQLSVLFGFSKQAPVSGVLYIIPILIIICGLLFFFMPDLSSQLVTMIFGGAILLFGISEIISGRELSKRA